MTGVVLIKSAVAVGALGEGALAVMAVVDPSITNIIGVVVGAIVTITMGIIAYKTVSLNKKFDAQEKKVDMTLQKAAVIEGHVNSRETALTGRIALLENEILLLREMGADKKTTAALLAQAAATAAPAPQATKESETFKNIEKHASDTANSTARTEEKMDATAQELKDKQ